MIVLNQACEVVDTASPDAASLPPDAAGAQPLRPASAAVVPANAAPVMNDLLDRFLLDGVLIRSLLGSVEGVLPSLVRGYGVMRLPKSARKG